VKHHEARTEHVRVITVAVIMTIAADASWSTDLRSPAASKRSR